MKSFSRARWACGSIVLGLLFLFSVSAAPTKLIRLRNQPIPPKTAKGLEPAQAKALNASGLFLIQFTGPVTAEAHEQLAALGVDLLHYVPDDTFVARLRSTRLTLLRTLPFVQWIGEYRPEHKLHRDLASKAVSQLPGQPLDVTVLLVPRANSAEIADAHRSFTAVRQQSTLRSGTILRGKVTPTQLDALSRSETVLWIEPYHPMKLVDEISSTIVAGNGGPNILLSQSLGYDGSGVKVAVADSGLNNGDAATMHPDLLGRTPAFFYYGSLTHAADEHSHGTHVSGIIAGNGATGETDDNGFLYGLGVAPGASIIAQRIFDGVGNFEPPAGGFEQLTRDATGAGAVIGSNSWGDDTQGAYDASAMEFDELVRDANSLTLGDQQYILEFSAGNAGPAGQTIGSPAVAKNVIATGASENDRLDFLIYDDGPEAMADFSSRGPCAGGRIKPDIVAPGRLLFFTFPLDAVPIGSGINDRINLLRNALSFLAPGASGLGTVALDSPAYPLPATVTIEVGDSDLAGQGTLNVTATSTTEPGGLPVTLQETVNRGDFVGYLSLLSSTNPPTAGKLRAKNGDTLHVNYFDASVNHNISATAAVDTVPPTISGVSAEPDYQQAAIFWNTSEAADALVEFGESTFLGRTAYDPNLDTFHAVELEGLAPDQTYYHRVVSRDAAGNTKVADNNGQLYTFHTLLPLLPPWSDNMNTGGTDWSVVTSDGSQTDWTLGVPNNSQETSAHSPPAAWGSNLKGDAIDSSETFLISPAIELLGGNSATLRFWHSYDFLFTSDFDILNEGDLLLITNNATTPTTLASYSDDISPGWIQETIDLSPFVGQVIYLVWEYEFFTLDARAQAGWLVDDVSITITNVQPGTVQITNNIWQANYILSGPVLQKAKGRSALITNAPPGQYVINFGDVLYYQTPPPQTNSLVSGATISFTGNYTLKDVNANGIPDAWELQYFGNVSTNRNAFIDTDGDGMSDLAEFIAGTDPNNPPRRFQVTARKLSSATCRLEWSSVPAVQYRVLSSSNLVSWLPYTGWLEATGAVSRVDVPMAPGPRSFFRIEVWTTAPAVGQPRDFRISAQRLPNGTINLTWNSVAGRGYRVEASTNGTAWSPISNWIQATTTTTTYPLPSLNPNSRMFRVQVQP